MIDARLLAKVTMFNTVEDLYNLHKARFDVVQAFLSYFTTFTVRNAAIRLQMQTANEKTKATTKAKLLALAKLGFDTEMVCKPVSAYAASIEDVELEAEMDWTAAKVAKAKKTEVESICQKIHDKATSLLVQAGPFNLTKPLLDQLAASIAVWKGKRTSSQTKKVGINNSKDQFEVDIKLNMKLLKKVLDPMVEGLMVSDAELVNLWKLSRKVINPAKVTTQLEVLVTALPAEIPVEEAEVIIFLTKDLKALTDENGIALYKPLKLGEYLVKVNAPGYEPYEQKKVRVKKGQVNKLKVKLVPAAVVPDVPPPPAPAVPPAPPAET